MSRSMPWFRCFPANELSILSSFTADVGYVYLVLKLRIFDVGGPVKEDVSTLSRRTGLSKPKVVKALEALITNGVVQKADGKLAIADTHHELAYQADLRGKQSRAGQASARKQQKTQSGAAEKDQHDQPHASTAVQPRLNQEETEEDEEAETSLRSVEPPKRTASDKRLARGDLCPPDYAPKPHYFELARTAGQGEAFVWAAAERMKNWSASNAHLPRARKSNWDKAFNNWLQRDLQQTSAQAARAPPMGRPIRNGYAKLLRGYPRQDDHHEPHRENGSHISAGYGYPGADGPSRSDLQRLGSSAGPLPPVLDLKAEGADADPAQDA
ncbi:MAG TPA: hypothetical protein VIL09_14980 [Microvirga sp.]|jgi:hypothetical protein